MYVEFEGDALDLHSVLCRNFDRVLKRLLTPDCIHGRCQCLSFRLTLNIRISTAKPFQGEENRRYAGLFPPIAKDSFICITDEDMHI